MKVTVARVEERVKLFERQIISSVAQERRLGMIDDVKGLGGALQRGGRLVGVHHAGELAVGLLHVLRGRVGLDTQHLTSIFRFQAIKDLLDHGLILLALALQLGLALDLQALALFAFGFELGLALGFLVLVLNFYTFPTPPAEAGSIDVGPFVGLWYRAATLQAWRSIAWARDRIGQSVN